MRKIRRDYKKCITASTRNEDECNGDVRPSSLFPEHFPYRARAFPPFRSVSDVTVIHYYEPPFLPSSSLSSNANARINIYYVGKKFSGILRLPREKGIFRGNYYATSGISNLNFTKHYESPDRTVSRWTWMLSGGGSEEVRSVNILFYYVTHSLLRVVEFVKRARHPISITNNTSPRSILGISATDLAIFSREQQRQRQRGGKVYRAAKEREETCKIE